MTTRFGLKRPSSGHYYKKFTMRYNTAQIMFVIFDPIRLKKVRYKIHIKIYKSRWIGNVLSVIAPKFCIKTSNISKKVVKIV